MLIELNTYNYSYISKNHDKSEKEDNEKLKSDEVIKSGFINWYRFKEIEKNSIYKKKGVYILKYDKLFGRLKGESDILYIGHTTNFCDRFVKNYLNGTGGPTTQRIHNYLISNNYVDKVKVSWIYTTNFEIEIELREKYEKEHHEFPPWNRQR